MDTHLRCSARAHAGAYTEKVVEAAAANQDFVMGFICQTPARWPVQAPPGAELGLCHPFDKQLDIWASMGPTNSPVCSSFLVPPCCCNAHHAALSPFRAAHACKQAWCT